MGMQHVTCVRCRNTVYRKVRVTKDKAMYCSRACSFAAASLLSAEKKALLSIGKKQRKRIDKANRELIRKKKEDALKIKKIVANKERLDCTCKTCGAEFKQRTHIGARELYCHECALENKRKERRIHRSRRRARIKGAKNEPIDPLLVFESHGWSCYVCGEDTPKKLRGTIKPRAPELDHIIPLSKGGSHTLDNVACCCRECNNEKADLLIA